MTWEVMLLALGLALIFEGLGPFLVPKQWQAFMQQLAQSSPERVQKTGAGLMLVGALLIFTFS